MRFANMVFHSVAGGLGFAIILLTAVTSQAKEHTGSASCSVTVVRTATWSEGDPAREGAAEFVVLVEIARLRQRGSHGGLVAVGDRRGLFSAGAEEALRHAVLLGLPVVKLAHNGQVLPAPHGLFLNGGDLSEEQAQQVLARCLSTYGALPVSGDEAVTPRLRNRLELFQREFNLAAGTQLAAR